MAKSGVKLMLDEERETREIKWEVYSKYLKATGSWWWAVIIGIALLLEQCATVGNSLMLGFWSDNKISGFSQGQYMATYAGERWLGPLTSLYGLTMTGLGLAIAVFTVCDQSRIAANAGADSSVRLFLHHGPRRHTGVVQAVRASLARCHAQSQQLA